MFSACASVFTGLYAGSVKAELFVESHTCAKSDQTISQVLLLLLVL